MKRTVTALAAAATIGLAATAAPTPASAYAWWVVPAVVAGGVVAVGTGAAIANQQAYAYAPGGAVYVAPMAATNCEIVRERTRRGWRRVQICD